MNIGRSYKQHGVSGDWDAIVIGSGIGGLTCAALLARHAAKKVLVLERHYTAGGFTHTFHRPGYEWDVGVHYIGEVHREGTLMRRVFDHLSDGELAWADMGEVYDTIVIGDDRYPFVRGRSAFRQRLIDHFPREEKAIDRYLELVGATVRAGKGYFLEKALPPAVGRVIGPVMRWPLMRHARRTTAEVLAGLTDDTRLRAVLAGQYGDYGLPPSQSSFFIHALIVHHYLGGAAYPVGGSSRIAATILPLIERAGGAVITSAEVDRILIDGGRATGVRLAGGEEVRAPLVISDAGIAVTCGRLLPEDIGGPMRVELAGIPPSLSHMSLYVGVKQTAAELGLRKGNLWVYPHEDHDRNLARFMADPDAPLPVAYLSFPSAKDPDFERRHPGRATIEVVTVAPWDWFARWQSSPWKKRGDDYESFKRRLSDRLLEPLLREYPVLDGKIDHQELSTPLSTRHFAGHPRGEIYGLAHTPARFAARSLRPHTPVRGLYLTGADVCSAGVGGALFGGVITASAVLRRNLLGAILRDQARAPRSAQGTMVAQPNAMST